MVNSSGSGTTSTRWYFPDWLSDPGVRASCLAAKGLWMDLLCIAAANKGRDHGFVMVGGRILKACDIARLVGAAIGEVEKLLGELAGNGVFNTDKRGAIYCRRMVRAEKNRANGRLGGNPQLLRQKKESDENLSRIVQVGVEEKPLKEKHNQESVEPMVNLTIPEPEPEPKERKKDSRAKPHESASDWPADYAEQFWNQYPRRVEKKKALEKLETIRKSGKVSWASLIGGVLRYAHQTSATEDRYIKHPTTWLNAGCWDDEPATSGGFNGQAAKGNTGGFGFAELAVELERRKARTSQARGFDAAGHEQDHGFDDPAFGVERMDGDGKVTLFTPRSHR